MIGTNFGAYRIDEKLGQGGMGVVYKAFDTTLHRPVAVKMIHAERKGSSDGMNEARFMREARAASRLQHPSVVTIHHFGIEDETEYIVMEFVEGKSLRKLIHDEPMPLDQFFEIAVQIAEGLSAAHEANIIHRDLKADNVMVTSKGQVKILDFGLAKLKDPVQTPDSDDTVTVFETQAGLAVGTATHMSPEQAMGREVDGKSDVFSFGVVLYHMLTGKVPFSGPNPAVTMARILEASPVPVRQLNPNVPEALEELVNRCLQKNRMFRPAAHDVAMTLKEIRDFSRAPRAQTAAAAAAAPQGNLWPLPATPSPGAVPAYTPTPTPAAPYPAPSGSATTPIPAVQPHKLYKPIKGIRIALSWLMYLMVACVLFDFVTVGLPVLGHDLERFRLYLMVRDSLAPVIAYLHHIIPQETSNGSWDMMILGLAIGLLVVRFFILFPVRSLEYRLSRPGPQF